MRHLDMRRNNCGELAAIVPDTSPVNCGHDTVGVSDPTTIRAPTYQNIMVLHLQVPSKYSWRGADGTN